MTETYEKNSCSPDCTPGMKCDFCTPEKSAGSLTFELAEENSASGHVCGGDCHCGPDSAVVPISSFTSAAAAAAFGAKFLDEGACRDWVISRLHPDGARCPGCGLRLDDDSGFNAGKRCVCGRCGKYFTATSSTFLQGAHLSYRQAFLLAVLIGRGFKPQGIAEVLNISVDTVRIWIKRFRVFEG